MSERPVPRSLPGATVVQIIPSLADTPVARAAVEVAIALLRSGARVITLGEEGPLVAELQGVGGEWTRLASDTTNPLSLRHNSRVIAGLVAAERVDLIHAHGVGASRSAAALKAGAGLWLVHSYVPDDLTRRWRNKSYGRALALGDRIIVPSHHVAELMTIRHRLVAERTVVIPERIDTSRFDPSAVSPERASVLRRGWKIARGERVILVPGALTPDTGQLAVVEAARILVNGGLNGVAFILAGDTRRDAEHAQAVTAQADAQGVAALVRLIGHCTDMPGAYRAADFVLVPQIAPPTFGHAVAEAMAMARPVIASAVGAIPELVRVRPDGRTGWLVPPDDPIALARAIADALTVDAQTYRGMALQARQLAESLFSPVRVAAATLEVYAGLLEGRG
jgi:glycosyltransferase involved in cell wall biosynthesis